MRAFGKCAVSTPITAQRGKGNKYFWRVSDVPVHGPTLSLPRATISQWWPRIARPNPRLLYIS